MPAPTEAKPWRCPNRTAHPPRWSGSPTEITRVYRRAAGGRGYQPIGWTCTGCNHVWLDRSYKDRPKEEV